MSNSIIDTIAGGADAGIAVGTGVAVGIVEGTGDVVDKAVGVGVVAGGVNSTASFSPVITKIDNPGVSVV